MPLSLGFLCAGCYWLGIPANLVFIATGKCVVVLWLHLTVRILFHSMCMKLPTSYHRMGELPLMTNSILGCKFTHAY